MLTSEEKEAGSFVLEEKRTFHQPPSRDGLESSAKRDLLINTH